VIVSENLKLWIRNPEATGKSHTSEVTKYKKKDQQ